jgi:integrase/recombinase XerC
MLEKFIRDFLDYIRITKFADKSIESYRIRLREFNEYVKTTPAKTIKDITYLHIREFVGDYKNPSEHVRKFRIWSLHQFYHYLELKDLVEENIAQSIPYPKIGKKVPEHLTIEEYNSLLKYFNDKARDYKGQRDLVIIMILGLLGLRLSSVISLNAEDIDIEAGLLWVKEKGIKERPVIIPGVLCNVLVRYMKIHGEEEGALFLSKRGKRISARTVQDILREASLNLGIEKHLHAHLFRHTAATHLNRVSGPEITQHVLGHMWRKNTDQYTHLNPEEYAVYMRLHPYMKGDIR